MKKKTADWLMSKTLPERYLMFDNVQGKIGGYKADFKLADDWIEDVQLICQTFTTAYEGVVENRATGKQMDGWFEDLCESKDENSPADGSPKFLAIVLPAGALKGIYTRFRRKMDFFKSNEAYTRAIGEDLMIVAPEGTERNINDAFPEFKPSADANNEITAGYVRGEFDGAEMQWRVAGTEMWQFADKSSEPFIKFTPDGITFPAKIELRGIYLLKNKRVGKWSPIYLLTIG